MPGDRITDRQVTRYMSLRRTHTQEAAAPDGWKAEWRRTDFSRTAVNLAAIRDGLLSDNHLGRSATTILASRGVARPRA